MVDSIEFFMLPSSEFRRMTLMKNIGEDDLQMLREYIPHPPSFVTPGFILKLYIVPVVKR